MKVALGVARLLPGLLLGVVLALVLVVLHALRIRAVARLRPRWTRWVLAMLARALPYEYRMVGALPAQPMLWVSNHVSWADVLVLGQLAPLTFLSKADVRHWPLLGWLASLGGTLFIRRGGGEAEGMRGSMSRHLRTQGSLVVFPEGTTTDGTTTATFHARLLGAAIEAQVPVQPVALRYLRDGQADPLSPFVGDDELWPHLKRLLANEKVVVEVHVLAAIDSQGHDRSSLARASRQSIDDVLRPSFVSACEAA